MSLLLPSPLKAPFLVARNWARCSWRLPPVSSFSGQPRGRGVPDSSFPTRAVAGILISQEASLSPPARGSARLFPRPNSQLSQRKDYFSQLAFDPAPYKTTPALIQLKRHLSFLNWLTAEAPPQQLLWALASRMTLIRFILIPKIPLKKGGRPPGSSFCQKKIMEDPPHQTVSMTGCSHDTTSRRPAGMRPSLPYSPS